MSPTRPSTLGCLIGLLGAMIFTATAISGIAAWLAYLRPEKEIAWQPLAWLTVGLLLVSFLISGLAWYRIKNGDITISDPGD